MYPLVSQCITLCEWSGFIPRMTVWPSHIPASERTEWQALSPLFSPSPSPPFLLPGKLINPIVVSCLDRMEFCDWIQHFKAADVPVLTPPPPVYDIIYTPTHREVRHTLLLKKQSDFSQPHMNHNYWGSYCSLRGWNEFMNDGEKGERADGQLGCVFVDVTAKCDCDHRPDHNSCPCETEVWNSAKYYYK